MQLLREEVAVQAVANKLVSADVAKIRLVRVGRKAAVCRVVQPTWLCAEVDHCGVVPQVCGVHEVLHYNHER